MSTFVLAVESDRDMSAVTAELKNSGAKIKQRLGSRYVVVESDRPIARLPVGVSRVDESPRLMDVSKTADGSELALAGWLARRLPGRLVVKENRPFDGASWDGPAAPPDHPNDAAGIGNPGPVGLLDPGRRSRVGATATCPRHSRSSGPRPQRTSRSRRRRNG